MPSDNSHAFELHCDFCNHTTTLVLAAVSISADIDVHCPLCGGRLGTLGELAEATQCNSPQAARLPV